MKTLRESKCDKRELILSTALRLFIDHGYLDTKVIDIAEAAGISKGSVYGYFASKEALFTELLKAQVVEPYAVNGMLLLEEDTLSCKDKIRRFVVFERETANRFGNGKNFVDLLYAESSLSRHPDLKTVMEELMGLRFATLHTIVAEGIRRGEFADIDPLLATLSLMGSIGVFISFECGLISVATDHLSFLSGGSPPWKEEDFFNLLFSGILAL